MALTTEIRDGLLLAGRYRVRERLGSGGMASVFLAEDTVLRRPVAIKRVHADGSEADARRLLREARLGASLVHPNLVTVYDTLSGSDGVLIVMEYIDGEPLSSAIEPRGMSSERALEVLEPVAAALDFAHQHGVVHRDVKPANVLIAHDGRVKLVDLGAATARDATQITAENEIVGTLSYIAPERLSGDSVGEAASDVYALAVLAFETMSGRAPRRADNPAHHLARALSGPPTVRKLWPEASPAVARVLEQGMDPDPDRRQASAGALVRDLQGAIADTDTATRPLAVPTQPLVVPAAAEAEAAPSPAPALRAGGPARSRWLVPAALAACAAIVLALVVAASGGGPTGGGAGQTSGFSASGGTQANAGTRARGKVPTTDTSNPSTPPPTAAVTGGASVAAGTALNNQGYALIQQGQYAQAVPILRRAVASFPQGTSDLNYAYALFNLGHALRLSGQPEAAIPILEQRLRFPDQTATVQAELDAARAAASGVAATTAPDGPAFAPKAKGHGPKPKVPKPGGD